MLWLFDIDGTLVDVSVIQRQAWRVAFGVSERPQLDLVDLDHHGATFAWIAAQTSVAVTPARRAEIERAHATALRDLLAGSVTPLLGVRELLADLDTAGHELGVLTGNSAPAAEILLESARLSVRIRRTVTGERALDRDELVATALGFVAHPSQLVIVGDTPRDVASARAAGAHAIAVATGQYSTTVLAESGPCLVVDRFDDDGRAAVLAWQPAHCGCNGVPDRHRTARVK